MNKLFLLILLLCASTINAQFVNVFYDDFLDNTNNWKNFDNKEGSCKLESGLLVLQNKQINGTHFFWKEAILNESKNFQIETKIKQTEGSDNAYGLSWNTKNIDYYYCFLIKSDGYFAIIGNNASGQFVLKDWTKNNYIKPKNEFNTLKIEKVWTKLYFYINGIPVHNLPYPDAFGTLHGIYLRNQISVDVDYLFVKGPKENISIDNSTITGTKKENMGLAINSSYSEIAPIISPDSKTLYVARAKHPSNYGNDKSMYDIWYSELQQNGEWSQLKNIGKPLNNEGDNLVISVSPDNNTLLVEGVYSQSGAYLGDQGISISYRTEKGWSLPKQIIIDDYYNRNEYESFCHSSDRKVLIMSVQRNDSYGDKDLYVSFLQDNGVYSKPKNMGKVLNTIMNDGTPFLAPDGKTLYYYTYGKAGYGSADIFVSKRLDETWTNWSEPKNLGPLVNSSDWDTYFSISASGDYAYLVSTKGSYGNDDIYRIKLTEDSKPEAVVLIFGTVYNKKTNKPIGADISYENLKTRKESGIATSNKVTGEYKIILPYGINYGFHAKAKDFISISDNIDLSIYKQYIEIKRNLYLAPIEVGETVALNNIFFVQGKPEILEESNSELERLYQLMKDNPTMEIELGGHTESRGNFESLVKLSQARVDTVKAFLVKKGINEKRIIGKGYGPSKPIADNNTEEGRKLNRRVEFKITRK